MTLVNALTVLYLACFASCGYPAILRIIRRKSSNDLSIWREALVALGVCAQFAVMLLTGANWRVWVSPINSFVSVTLMLGAITYYRHRN